MTKRLGENDRRAVDLLLDRSNGAIGNDNGFVTHAQSATEPAIQAVRKVLNVLELAPAAEPPADLMIRTLARIDSRMGAAAPMHPAATSLMTDRPHA